MVQFCVMQGCAKLSQAFPDKIRMGQNAVRQKEIILIINRKKVDQFISNPGRYIGIVIMHPVRMFVIFRLRKVLHVRKRVTTVFGGMDKDFFAVFSRKIKYIALLCRDFIRIIVIFKFVWCNILYHKQPSVRKIQFYFF